MPTNGSGSWQDCRVGGEVGEVVGADFCPVTWSRRCSEAKEAAARPEGELAGCERGRGGVRLAG
jgi:hypothetical protein